MDNYYSGRRAQHYNARWRTYSERTLAETLAMIDLAALRSVPARLGCSPRLLDVACGTGLLLKRLLDHNPGAEAYGVDGSEDMLAQARVALKGQPHVYVERVQIGTGEAACLPFAPQTFDLITCTNALHDLPDPAATLVGLRRLLAAGEQLVVEDFARREPIFLWSAFEGLLQRLEGSRVHAYTLSEAQSLCQQAGLRVARGRAFVVDWFWRAWVLRTYREAW